MANELKIFENEEFGKVRTTIINNEIMFVGKDVAKVLGYSDTNKAIATHVDSDDKLNDKTALSLGQRGGWFINESGLYSLIISSKMPNAKKFKHWVTSEVLPSIRKNGGYIYNQENKTTEEILASAYVVAMNVINEKQALIEKMQPKVDFFDAVAESSDAVSIGEVAKVLKVKGVGRNKLFEFLRRQKVLDRHNIPYQKYINCGWFRTIEQKYDTPDGETHVSIKTLVYQKGVDGIRKLLESKEVA